MGNLYRFVEPVLLLLLKKKGRSYGYELADDLQAHALTDAAIERAALYRTLADLGGQRQRRVGVGNRQQRSGAPGVQADTPG